LQGVWNRLGGGGLGFGGALGERYHSTVENAEICSSSALVPLLMDRYESESWLPHLCTQQLCDGPEFGCVIQVSMLG
jgi:hypothetical protein